MRHPMEGSRTTKESGSHTDRDERFPFIIGKAAHFQAVGEPVMAVVSIGTIGNWIASTTPRKR